MNNQAMLMPVPEMDPATIVANEERMFELAQRRAKVYATSTLVPKEYQNNIGNVLIAQNMAQRLGADLLQVMQNLYVVHGKPGWSAQFLIATFNTCGKFSAIRYRFTGERGKPSWGCIAYATELSTGEKLEGTEITLEMAKAEGWYDKNGSKWKTMPEQMLRYRAASYLVRTVAPEVSMGLVTVEELRDEQEQPVQLSAMRGMPGLKPRIVSQGGWGESGITQSEPAKEIVTDVENVVAEDPNPETNGGEISAVEAELRQKLDTTTAPKKLESLKREIMNADLDKERKNALLDELDERYAVAMESQA